MVLGYHQIVTIGGSVYQPNQDIAKLSQRFNAQAQARNSGWFGKLQRLQDTPRRMPLPSLPTRSA